MAQAELTPNVRPSIPGLHFDWVPSMFRKPRAAFERILVEEGNVWWLPLAVLTVSAVLLVFVTAHAASDAAAGSYQVLPSDFGYYPPQSQEQLLQAMEVTNGFTFRYLFPGILSVARVWLGWLIVAASLHLFLTMMGGRGSIRSAMNLVAWSGLPFAVRDLVRVAYIGFSHQAIHYPGLSGFFTSDSGTAFTDGVTALLGLIDIYWLWHVALLVLAVKTYHHLSANKGLIAVASVQFLALLIQIVPALLAQRLAGLGMIRPFIF